MKGAAAEIAAAVFLLALVMILVRPNSLAPKFVGAFGDAMTAVVKYAVSG
ncbi:MAG: hypothetical protein HOY76_18615 [Streptomyces sp.]|nr:hypothetical protein [Streptomyces sp.]